MTALIALLALSQADAGAEPALAAAAGSPVFDPAVLGMLLRKSILTQAEHEAAVAGLPPPDDGRSPVMSRWAASLYGFVELDVVAASTQSAFEQPANAAIARPGTAEADRARVSLSARNSRLGLKLSTPQAQGMRASAIIEADLMGNAVAANNDAVLFTGGGPRVRHLALSFETPVVDVLVGQFWQPFGWQPHFFPNTVEIQGLIGEVYGRVPQLKLSHTFKSPAVDVEAELAMTRPVERLFGVPDYVAGVRLAVNGRKGLRTSGASATRVDAMMLGVSTLVRHFDVPVPGGTAGAWGWGLSLDALLPIRPGSLEQRANALTLTASFVTGAGIADQQSGFTAGIGSPAPSIDPGLVVLGADGRLYPIVWRTLRFGLQYYLPVMDGNVWAAANWGQNVSPNAGAHGARDQVYTDSHLLDFSLFMNALGALRFGLSYAVAWQQYADGTAVEDHRAIFAAFFLF